MFLLYIVTLVYIKFLFKINTLTMCICSNIHTYTQWKIIRIKVQNGLSHDMCSHMSNTKHDNHSGR